MEAIEEKTLARKILSLDEEARDLLSTIPMANQILTRRSLRAEQTRAASLKRLREAAETCAQADDEVSANVGRRAQGKLEQADQLRWSLAMSAQRVARSEARKLSLEEQAALLLSAIR